MVDLVRTNALLILGVVAVGCGPIVDESTSGHASATEVGTDDDPSEPGTETTETGDEMPPVEEDPIGEVPGGGNALAIWHDDMLELVFSNATSTSCDEPSKLPDCGPPDAEVWVSRVRVPLDAPIPGEWMAGELSATSSVRGPASAAGDCYAGFGAGSSEMDLRIDVIDGRDVYGSVEGLFGSSGPFIAIACP